MARGARQGEQGGRLAAHVRPRHLHARPAGLAGEPGKGLAQDKPDSIKGYTIGDNTHKNISRYPWRMDDEKVAYKGYELAVKHGIKNVCVHKGLFAPGSRSSSRICAASPTCADVGKAAKDWPQLNFVIYHSAYRHVGGDPKVARPSSSAPAAFRGPATSPTSPRSTASATSTATSASCSRPRSSPSPTCARR